MKISHVQANNRRRCFIVRFGKRELPFPYTRCEPPPTPENPIVDLYIDAELARQGFTYVLKSGEDGAVLLDYVLDHNSDPTYVRDMLLYRLTLEAQDQVKKSPLSRRELIRRLGTSPAQFYRLLDQTNYRKTMDQVVRLLVAAGGELEFVVSRKDQALSPIGRINPSRSRRSSPRGQTVALKRGVPGQHRPRRASQGGQPK